MLVRSSADCTAYLLKNLYFFFFQAEDGIRDIGVTGVQTCALPIFLLETMTCWNCSGVERRESVLTVNSRWLDSRRDRERGVLGKRVGLGGRRIIKKKKTDHARDSGMESCKIRK